MHYNNIGVHSSPKIILKYTGFLEHSMLFAILASLVFAPNGFTFVICFCKILQLQHDYDCVVKLIAHRKKCF